MNIVDLQLSDWHTKEFVDLRFACLTLVATRDTPATVLTAFAFYVYGFALYAISQDTSAALNLQRED
jgi:hypothetical protein